VLLFLNFVAKNTCMSNKVLLVMLKILEVHDKLITIST
jgi:hypothetical protein